MANSGFCNKFSKNFKACQIFFFQYFWLKYGENVVDGILYDFKKFQTKIKKMFERNLKLNLVKNQKIKKLVTLYALVTHDPSKNLP